MVWPFDILRCWKYDHLQTSEYSLQGKYKGEVTNTTENGHCGANTWISRAHLSSSQVSQVRQGTSQDGGLVATKLYCTLLHSNVLDCNALYCIVIVALNCIVI